MFNDGPPFANGLPHYGHLLTGYVKDVVPRYQTCLLYTSDAADERSSVDLGGRRIIKKKKSQQSGARCRGDVKHSHKQATRD